MKHRAEPDGILSLGCFNAVGADMALEQTINKSQKKSSVITFEINSSSTSSFDSAASAPRKGQVHILPFSGNGVTSLFIIDPSVFPHFPFLFDSDTTFFLKTYPGDFRLQFAIILKKISWFMTLVLVLLLHIWR